MGTRVPPAARGFTVIELIVATAIVAVVLGLAFPVWEAYVRDRQVMRTADDVAGLLRFAQQAAVADSADACGYRGIILSTRAEAVKVSRDASTGTCTSPEVLMTVRVTDTFPRGVAATPATLQFASTGGLQTCGGPASTIAVWSGARVRTIAVEPCTGRVEVLP